MFSTEYFVWYYSHVMRNDQAWKMTIRQIINLYQIGMSWEDFKNYILQGHILKRKYQISVKSSWASCSSMLSVELACLFYLLSFSFTCFPLPFFDKRRWCPDCVCMYGSAPGLYLLVWNYLLYCVTMVTMIVLYILHFNIIIIIIIIMVL